MVITITALLLAVSLICLAAYFMIIGKVTIGDFVIAIGSVLGILGISTSVGLHKNKKNKK
jgi:uncharacterized membrane protein (DUF485 family)